MRALNPIETKLVEESKKQVEKRKIRIKAYKITGMVLIIMVIITAVFAIWQWKEALSGSRIITANYLVSQAQLKVDEDPTAALGLAEKAWDLNKNDITTAALYKIYRENNFYKIIARLEQEAKSAVFSRDGQYIIAGFYDGTIRCWNLQGEELTDFKKDKADIPYPGFSQENRCILKSTGDGIVRLWDKKGSKSQDFTGHEGQLISYAFSPDGKYILTGSSDHTARLWALKGNQLQVFKGHNHRVLGVCKWVYSRVVSRKSKKSLKKS